MKRKSKLIPYISLIPFTDIIHMLRDWLLIGTSVIILTGVGLSYYESRKGRMESRRSEARSEARWEEFRVELLCRVPEPPPPPQRHHLCSHLHLYSPLHKTIPTPPPLPTTQATIRHLRNHSTQLKILVVCYFTNIALYATLREYGIGACGNCMHTCCS